VVAAVLAERDQLRWTFMFILISLFVPAVLLNCTVNVEKGVCEGEAYAVRHAPGDEGVDGPAHGVGMGALRARRGRARANIELDEVGLLANGDSSSGDEL